MSEVKLAVCAIADIDKHLLLLHRRNPDQWQLPGGRIEAGEVPAQAVIREVNEELDIAVTSFHYLSSNVFTQRDTHYFYELFQVTQYEGEPRLTEPHMYEEFAYHNLFARRIGSIGLSPLAEDLVRLLQNEEVHLER